MLPFTREQFFAMFATYNSANSAAVIGAYPVAFAALVIAWRARPQAGRTIGVILAFMWGWVGFVYHGIYFSQINPLAKLFAGAFLIQSVLFAIAGLRHGLRFGPRNRLRSVAGAVLIFYAMVAYPLIGLLLGEHYPAMPLFGVAPCPLLIFTFGLLVWASCAAWWLWVVPLLWSVIGGSASVVLSVPQDAALPVSAVAVLLMLLTRRPRNSAAGNQSGTSP